MNKPEFISLGVTKQLAYINRLENINSQKQRLIESISHDNRVLNTKLLQTKGTLRSIRQYLENNSTKRIEE